MKRLFAAVAISALALTSVVPTVVAAERSAPSRTELQAQDQIHQVATKKKKKRVAKKKPAKVAQTQKRTA